ncbi:DUF3106 domain-containing protein [Luteimonas sp. MC1895]|uniref:DUF3106 domain-containing protein n=1 Tax=Luteimonas sp. MC1895 TaxID=2819513 RepID=UPI001F39A967|nr:DUF3106 domain-containing protein [Luteimonas sp. MC1895]
MTPRSPADPTGAPASTALAAFLRGVERRGLVFAWLLAGSRETGGQALAWALERFRREAGRIAFGDWSRHFWALLLAAPALRTPPTAPRWEAGLAWLSGIGHGPRAALLLRLVAGLAESDASTVLGISRPTYRLGLQRALPHREDGSADVEAWEALGRSAQELVRNLPPEPVAAHAPTADDDDATPTSAGGRRPLGRGLRVALALVALLTLLALGLTFRMDRLPDGLDAAPGHILSEALPAAEAPAGRYGEDDALALHPDLALLLDAGNADPAAADPAFHAWLVGEAAAAGGATEGADTPAGADRPADAAVPVAPVPAPADAARIDAAALRPADQRLADLAPAARGQLSRQRDLWDALPHAERGERRERWLAWRDLAATERAAMRAAAARFAARTPAEQAALRARFDALDASDRHGWLLGPDLGPDYPRLHALVAQVPTDARAAMLEVLRGLDPQGRDDLAVLAARTPPQSRAELRVELLATPAAQRGRWLRNRVAPPPGGSGR